MYRRRSALHTCCCLFYYYFNFACFPSLRLFVWPIHARFVGVCRRCFLTDVFPSDFVRVLQRAANHPKVNGNNKSNIYIYIK
ncbi:hypothetical protein TRSC58_07607 [Trypanosoma rangeli SC58]|uniref:Uncharacterized protein n=1 Tax=Trypanosoma rangeli SC58 TaxID=429131 RepID=A0A061ISU6_TRYRA|nr:hypothetical protein TRSC58_07607 [Trypanosoma rangeli SC58]